MHSADVVVVAVDFNTQLGYPEETEQHTEGPFLPQPTAQISVMVSSKFVLATIFC